VRELEVRHGVDHLLELLAEADGAVEEVLRVALVADHVDGTVALPAREAVPAEDVEDAAAEFVEESSREAIDVDRGPFARWEPIERSVKRAVYATDSKPAGRSSRGASAPAAAGTPSPPPPASP